VNREITYPSEEGKAGIMPLFPQAIKYTATPSDTEPAYTDYITNTWEMDLTAGTTAYLFGSSANYYYASPVEGKRAMLVIFQHGLLEIGTTPKIYQMRVYSKVEQRKGAFAVHPLVEVPVEHGKVVYQYNTLGVVFVYWDLGIKWELLPVYTGRSKLPLLGVVLYEHDFFSTLKYVS